MDYYSKRVNDRATNGVMTQQEVKCTPNNQCKCIVSNEKWGMLLREMQNSPSNEKYSHSYMKIWLILFQANLVQVPCKMQNEKMHNNVKSKCFVFFELKWDKKAKVWLYNPQNMQVLSYSTQDKH